MLDTLKRVKSLVSNKQPNLRATAARVLLAIIEHKRSLNIALANSLPNVRDKDKALLQQICYGVLRWQPTLSFLAAQLLQKTFKKKDKDLQCLLLTGLYQLRSMRTPAHAAISETVNAARQLGKPWAVNVLNACLRNYQRNQQSLETTIQNEPQALYAHPAWLLKQYQQDWPQNWQQIIASNNQQPSMLLRVNTTKTTVSNYLQLLQQQNIKARTLAGVSTAIRLETPVNVESLPYFAEGWVSVQDGAAQLTGQIMNIRSGQRILDACAAPGGKTCHLLELATDNEIIAIDIDRDRLQQIQQNLDRLGLQAMLIAADATNTEQWWDGQFFDRILLDAPCSGSGVVRRHPDIKILKKAEDIAKLTIKQQQLLEKLWPLLKPGGLLVYTTCSVIKQENEDQIAYFLSRHPEAREQPCLPPPARNRPHGYQRLPGDDEMDGFFYACLQHI